MTRHVIFHNFNGMRLVGTYHEPTSSTGDIKRPRATSGVLLLNAGPAPRAGNSDMSVAICERLALEGHQSFRFDLPGLGDSSGASPSDIPAYWSEVLKGRNDEAARSIVEHLAQSYGLTSLAIGGLCAGAVTAIRVAASQQSVLSGLILLEPNFRLELGVVMPRQMPGVRLDRPLTKVSRKLRDICSRLGLTPYPPETDVSLFRALHTSLERGVDTIAVLADGLQSTRHMTIVGRHLSRRGKPRLTLVNIERTNHILTSGDAKSVTCEAIARWLNDGSGSVRRSA